MKVVGDPVSLRERADLCIGDLKGIVIESFRGLWLVRIDLIVLVCVCMLRSVYSNSKKGPCMQK